MLQPFVLPESVASFYDYFRLAVGTETVLSALGYGFATQHLVLPRTTDDLPAADLLRTQIEGSWPLVDLTSETARREMLIAPILLEVSRHVRAKLRIEYPIDVGARLRGNLDYLLLTEREFLVVEAKQGDMTRGFTQLAAEMIAVDIGTETKSAFIYGAVSVGDIWRFGILDRSAKKVVQDVATFAVPYGLGDLLPILIGIMQGSSPPSV